MKYLIYLFHLFFTVVATMFVTSLIHARTGCWPHFLVYFVIAGFFSFLFIWFTKIIKKHREEAYD